MLLDLMGVDAKQTDALEEIPKNVSPTMCFGEQEGIFSVHRTSDVFARKFCGANDSTGGRELGCVT